MGFLSKLFTKNIGAGFMSLMTPKQSTATVTDGQLASAYRKWVYKCVKLNANAIASQNLRLIAMDSPSNLKVSNVPVLKHTFKHDTAMIKKRLFKQANQIAEIVTHPYLELMEKPNQKDSQYTLLYAIATNMELFGTAYVRVSKDPTLGIPVNLEVLHSQFISPKLDKSKQQVVGYFYGMGNQKEFIPLDEMIVISYYNPSTDIKGFAPLNAVYAQYELDMSFDEYALAVNRNSGNPGSVIQYKTAKLNEEKRDWLERQWNLIQGVENAGRTKVIGSDFNVVQLGLSPKELDFMAGRRVTKEAIFGAFDVPLSFSDPKDVNRSSFDTAIMQHQMFAIEPKIRQIVADINTQLIAMYEEPRLTLTYDDPVLSRKKDKVDELIKLKEAEIITAEEARRMVFDE